ncbi:hypothetical protein OsI_37860 [Oryza sativa Indica Group]|uniref:Uncharacterized protein n=1 Tax=Oryza sativa subsp. indica TaxID=39946 RepID=A2ZJ58_ORYSI|nr:hypothetical protein OsI_37860 [Oryza sativa Indica Group]
MARRSGFGGTALSLPSPLRCQRGLLLRLPHVAAAVEEHPGDAARRRVLGRSSDDGVRWWDGPSRDAPGGGRGGSSGDGGGQWVGRAATASGGGRDGSSCDGAGRLGGRVATMPAGDLLSSSAVAGGLHAHRSTADA